MEPRIATVNRVTKETDISLTLNLDGSGQCSIDTGIGFFDHMLNGFARHGLFDLTLKCRGDLEVDSHHTVEDCGIVLGEAIRQAVLSCREPSVLLITGKGAETRQKRGLEYIDTPSDVDYVRAFLQEYDARRGR